MSLILLIIIATIAYTLFDIFSSRASNNIDANLSSFIFNGLGAIIPIFIYGFYKLSSGEKTITTNNSGILYSVLAGLAITVFSVFLIKIFEKGGLAYVVPLIFGGTIVLASLAGWLIFKESVSGLQITGILITIIGIALVVVAKMELLTK
jgi:uncharacterized membrane protein